jgi:hypothetical protein
MSVPLVNYASRDFRVFPAAVAGVGFFALKYRKYLVDTAF